MGLLTMLSGPVIGAVIGYITNDIAIRMLFRPHKAIYVLGRRLPFTPGIVPRRKNQLATILGNAIVEKFFNADDLEIVFTDGICDAVADSLVTLLRSEVKPSDVIDFAGSEKVERMERELCIRIQSVVCTSDIPETLVAQAGSALVSSAGDGAAKSVTENLMVHYAARMSHELREFIIEHGYSLIFPMLKQEAEQLAAQPVSDLTALLYGEDDALLREAAKQLYLRFMAHHVRPIVESIDVGGMITEKIIQMTSEEVEDLVLSVVRRELRLVVLFGAFVGAIIGTINILI